MCKFGRSNSESILQRLQIPMPLSSAARSLGSATGVMCLRRIGALVLDKVVSLVNAYHVGAPANCPRRRRKEKQAREK